MSSIKVSTFIKYVICLGDAEHQDSIYHVHNYSTKKCLCFT